MTKESKSVSSKSENSIFCTTPVSDSLQEKLLSKREGPYIIEEVYHSGAMKINNAEGTNPKAVSGQRIKHYISSMPINVESNIIQTMTPGEHIKETSRNTPES